MRRSASAPLPPPPPAPLPRRRRTVKSDGVLYYDPSSSWPDGVLCNALHHEISGSDDGADAQTFVESDPARPPRRLRLARRAALVVVFGCAAVVPSEMIMKRDPKGMTIMTCAFHVYTLCAVYLARGSSPLRDRQIPGKYHAALVATAVLYNELQTATFALGMPMALVLVVKNAGLVVQMVAGRVILRETYSARQVASALVVTVGVIITVRASRPAPRADAPGDEAALSARALLPCALLVASLISRAIGNVIQQVAFREFGSHTLEVLFYQSLLGLPFVLVASGRGLVGQLVTWTTASPTLWLHLALTIGATFYTTRCCSDVVGMSSSVFLNLVLTAQRFVSIVLSSCVLNAPPYPPPNMWAGAVCVILGSVAFVIAPKRPPPSKEKSS